MARYIQNAHMDEISPDEYTDFRTIFHGASEAPRVHGMLGDKFDRLPRFKNHYFVAFQYTDLNKSSANPKMIIDVMHRIKSVDAPKFEIETDTLNQYNKPRLIPTKIVYQPITITFHDDKSNYTTDFWRRIYQFYFLNGQRLSESQYSTRDSDIVIDDGVTPGANYNNYGYYIDNKVNKKNLFYSMSLYMLQNQMCTRMDLINPQLQSMQHDQFSQELSSELAQNTTMWGYENVVYYSSRPMYNDQTLRAHNYAAGDPAIFQSSPKNPDPAGQRYHETYTTTATGESTAPQGNKGDFFDDGQALGFGDDMGADDVENILDHTAGAQPKFSLATKTPETGFIPKSGLDSKISHYYWALATGREDLLLNPYEAAEAKAAEAAATNYDFGAFSGGPGSAESRAVDGFTMLSNNQGEGTTDDNDETGDAAMEQNVARGTGATGPAGRYAAKPAVPTGDSASQIDSFDTAKSDGYHQLDADKARMDALIADPKNEFNKGIKKTGQALQSALTSQFIKGFTVDQTSGKVTIVPAGSGTFAEMQKKAVDAYNAKTPAQRAADDLARAKRQQEKEDNAN